MLWHYNASRQVCGLNNYILCWREWIHIVILPKDFKMWHENVFAYHAWNHSISLETVQVLCYGWMLHIKRHSIMLSRTTGTAYISCAVNANHKGHVWSSAPCDPAARRLMNGLSTDKAAPERRMNCSVSPPPPTHVLHFHLHTTHKIQSTTVYWNLVYPQLT